MLRKLTKFLFILFVAIAPLHALANIVAQNNLKLVGKGEYSFYFWDLYKAELYSETGKYSVGKDFALKLIYHRDILGKDIAESTISEMKKQGFKEYKTLTKWEKKLLDIYPDIKAKDSLTGIYSAKTGATSFYHNDKLIAKVEDKLFSEKFFDIWLSEKTSAPRLRNLLLGNSQ